MGVHPPQLADRHGCWRSTCTSTGQARARLLGMHRAVMLPVGCSRSHPRRRQSNGRKVCTCGHNASPAQCGGLSANPHPTEKRISHALLLFFRGRAEHGVFPNADDNVQHPAAVPQARDPQQQPGQPALSWACWTHNHSPMLEVCLSFHFLVTLKCINQTATQANHHWKS